MVRKPTAASSLVGQHIRDRRAQCQMTSDQLAVAAGVDAANMRSYENGRSIMNLRTLTRIAEALDTEPGALLAGLRSEMFDGE